MTPAPAALRLLLASAALLGAARAHLCFLFPSQRGAVNVTTPGDPSCYRRRDYCGGVAPGAPLTTFAAGETVTVLLQQNLNHFFPARPGFVDVAIAAGADPNPADFVSLATLADAPAFDMVAQTVLEVRVTLPAAASAHSVLRARYVSFNPLEIDPPTNADAVFFNCADIAITAAVPATAPAAVPAAAPAAVPAAVPAAIPAAAPAAVPAAIPVAAPASTSEAVRAAAVWGADAAYSCSTPPSWTANFTESNDFGFVQHTIFWDAPSNMTRWDQAGNLDASGPSQLILINNYTTPVEWVNFVAPANKCLAYGNDAFYPFSFGAVTNMTYDGRTGAGVDLFSVVGARASWTTQDLGGGLCRPLSWVRGRASAALTGFAQGPIDPAVFVPAAACTQSPAARCGGAHA